MEPPPPRSTDEKFRTAMWAVALALLLILGVAQLDEHRRFRRDSSAALAVSQQRAEAELTRLEVELAGSQGYLDALRMYARDEAAFRQREMELLRASTRYSVIEPGTTQPATAPTTTAPTTTAPTTTAPPGPDVVLVRPVRPKPPAAAPRAITTPAPLPRFEDYQFVSRIRRGVCISAFVACAALPVAALLGSRQLRRRRGAIAEAMLVLALLGTGGMMLGWGYWRNWNVFAWDNNAAGWGLILIPAAVVATILSGRRDARDGAAR